jgi:indolepyruvate ferredoxin oxidoreductase, beta subunit
MSANRFEIYMIGVGGQGIGLLSEALVRAADMAGHEVRGVDTHGLAQRGGTVVSNLRLGPGIYSPLVRPGHADLVIALERHEAVRGGAEFLRPEGTLVYYDATWQPLAVRLRREAAASHADLEAIATARNARLLPVFDQDLADSRMQNVVVLATLAREKSVPELLPEHYEAALTELLRGPVRETNLALFRQHLDSSPASP